MPVSLEKNLEFEQESEAEEIESDSSFELKGIVSSVSFHLSGDGKVELQVELVVCGTVTAVDEISVISEMCIRDRNRCLSR